MKTKKNGDYAKNRVFSPNQVLKPLSWLTVEKFQESTVDAINFQTWTTVDQKTQSNRTITLDF